MDSNHFIIGVPTYNRANLISRVVDSVEKQALDTWSLLFVNDASSDETETLLSEYNKKHNGRFHYFSMDKNSGVNKTRNRIIDEAKKIDKDAFLLLIDDDDYLTKNCLSDANKEINKNPDYAWYTMDCICKYSKPISILKKYGDLSYLEDYMFGKNMRGDMTHIIRLSKVGNIRFSNEFKNAETWYFWCHLSAKHRMYAINAIGSIKDYLPEGITKSAFNRDKAIQVLEYKIKTLTPLVGEKRMLHQYVSLAKHLLKSGQKDEAKYWLKLTFNIDPYYLRQYKFWIKTIFVF